MLKKLILSIAIMLYGIGALSQTHISGRIQDAKGSGIANANIAYSESSNLVILGHTSSNDSGFFKLTIKNINIDSLRLIINHLSFSRKTMLVLNETSEYKITLYSKIRQLEAVNITNPPIYKKNDTLNYDVQSFSSKRDRVIADIISKLPGIDIRGDQIFYQGNPIQKYKVNNLDLMEGRYSMINKNLPAEAVKSVQIVENDQPIKILDSLEFSDRATLNLELKKYVTTGMAKLGVGIKPLLWKANITPITLGQRFQMLNSFQGNNVGNNVSENLRSYYRTENFISHDSSDFDSPGKSFLSLKDLPEPDLNETKWLNNRAFLVSSNLLQKLADGSELKGNFSFYNDLQKKSGLVSTQLFVPNGSVFLNEDVNNEYRISDLNLGLVFEKNEKKIFLRDNFVFHKQWSQDRGSLLMNYTDEILQNRKYDDQHFSNRLAGGRFIGKQLIRFNSEIEWLKTPQYLNVVPGQMMNVLNDEQPYEMTQQNVTFNKFKFDNTIGLTKKLGNWDISPYMGFKYTESKVNSSIFLSNEDKIDTLGDGYLNNIRSRKGHLFISTDFSYERNKWRMRLSVPYNFFVFHIDQQGRNVINNNRQSVTPSLSVNFSIDQNNRLSFKSRYGRDFIDLDNLYNAFILSSYRNIQRYTADLLQTDELNSSVNYEYKNDLKGNFATLSYNQSFMKRGYTFRNELDELGRTVTSIDNRSSNSTTHRIKGSFSRYFWQLKTIVKASGLLGLGMSDYLLNDIFAQRKMYQHGASLDVSNSLISMLNVDYKSRLSFLKSDLAGAQSNKILVNSHFLNFVLYLTDASSIFVDNSYYLYKNNSQKNQYFLDITYRYLLKRLNADLELSGQNLFNRQGYVQQFSTDYQVVQSFFNLRPRQVLLSILFRL